MNTPNNTHRVTHERAWPLYGSVATRAIEQAAQGTQPDPALMQRAGLAVAQLALALAPHAQQIWVACGPGNNGGDGLAAAAHLQRWGKKPVVTWLGTPEHASADTRQAWQQAHDAGVTFSTVPPIDADLVIDALLGLGCDRPPQGQMAQWLTQMHLSALPVLHVDLPSGLHADTGVWYGHPADIGVCQHHTLSLLTLKPGLFTAHGRDAAGVLWFDDLGVSAPELPPNAWCQPAQGNEPARWPSSHKGSHGDVVVVGGAKGMTGAAILAGMAALHGGAGRVYAALLDGTAHAAVSAQHPALMVRYWQDMDLRHSTVVCGCGGGTDIRVALPTVLSNAARLVLDADALNAVAGDSTLRTLLQQRATRGHPTVLTPHPLEAARLLEQTVGAVQDNRQQAVQELAHRFQCVAVLKGSGTLIAAPDTTTVINPSGNANLATAGTGDVLAGLMGARIACAASVFEAACQAVARHGWTADHWPASGPRLDAAQLAHALR